MLERKTFYGFPTARFDDEEKKLLSDALNYIRGSLEKELTAAGFKDNESSVEDLLTVQNMIISLNGPYFDFNEKSGRRVIERIINVFSEATVSALEDEDFSTVVNYGKTMKLFQQFENVLIHDQCVAL